MTTNKNSLQLATQLMQDPELKMRIQGAVALHVNQLFLEAHTDPQKEMLARQLNENHDYSAKRILQHLAFDPEITLDHAALTDDQIIAKVVEVSGRHTESGLWPVRR